MRGIFRSYYSEVDHLDPDQPAEFQLLHCRNATLEEEAALAIEQLRWLMEGCQGDDQRLASATRLQVGLPVGCSYYAWCDYLLTFIPEVATAPDEFHLNDTNSALDLPRVSRFPDFEHGKEVMLAVLERNRPRIEAWGGNPLGFRRLQVYAEFDQPVGEMDFSTAEEKRDPVPAHGAVVVLALHPRQGPVPLCAYPEMSLPVEARDEYPDLATLFGGYFGQDLDLLDHNRFIAERELNEGLSARNRKILAEQLEALLDEGDRKIRESVRALGSYVEPTNIRRWVTGLHRRMTRVDWGVRE
jgi:hypothetical protein